MLIYFIGWHSKLNRKIGKAHPNLFEFVFTLQKFQQQSEQNLENLLNGEPIPQPDLCYRRLDQAIKNLKLHLANNEIDPIRFLDGIGKKIRFKE